MYLVQMRPEQIQDGVRRNVPVLMAAGVVEYHGPHLPVGTDYLIASSICKAAEQRCEVILAPDIPFGPTMSWAGGPEEGEIDFEPEPMFQYALAIFRHMLRIGFRRIYVLQHHQGTEGLQSLCLQRAAREVTWELAHKWQAGWGRSPVMPEPAIFSCIRVASIDTFCNYPSPDSPRVPVGHAGMGETQLIMASYPDAVRIEALESWQGPLPEWLVDAPQATLEEGKRWLEFCIQGWVKELACLE
jgi:creatinine amidohydrolase